MSVVFPQPEGPTIATVSPGAHGEVDVAEDEALGPVGEAEVRAPRS